MGIDRTERLNSLLLREVSDDMYKILGNDPEIDLVRVTITRIDIAPNLRNADVWVSFLTDPEQQGAWLRKLARHAKDFQECINKNMCLKYTPKLRFRLDLSVAKGDHVLDILNHLEEITPVANEESDEE